MKIILIASLLGLCFLMFLGGTFQSRAADSTDLRELTPHERRQAVIDRIETVRARNEELFMRSARVYQPGSQSDELDPSSLRLDNASFGYAAQLYAKLVRREVMVSMRVAILPISIDVNGLSKRDSISQLEKEFQNLGIKITKIGKHTVVLTLASD